MGAESFSERLRRLRREQAKGSPALPYEVPELSGLTPENRNECEAHNREAKPPPSGMPVWLRHKLKGIGEVGTSERARQVSDGVNGLPPARPDLPLCTGIPAGIEEFTGDRGVFAARIVRRPKSDLHGDWSLEWAEDIRGESIAPLVRDADLGDFDGARAVYLDIETTGLGGGVGTWPFMVALGRFDGDDFELWQGFLRDPGEEAALLAEVSRRIGNAAALVSFFGKSFDRHRLEDKMRLHRIEPPFDGLPHLDLYHPLNRLYCRRGGWDQFSPGRGPGEAVPLNGQGYANGKLSTMERELCGLKRADDLSGAFAPEAWFDYLGSRPHLLEHVFRHNADDVWSLATLTAHLGRAALGTRPDGAALEGPLLAKLIGLAKLARDRSDRNEEARLLVEVERQLGGASLPRKLALWFADAHRLAGSDSFELYEQLVSSDEDFLTARIEVELAKLLEHKRHDLNAALEACERARAVAVRHGPRAGTRFSKELDARAARLSRKLRSVP